MKFDNFLADGISEASHSIVGTILTMFIGLIWGSFIVCWPIVEYGDFPPLYCAFAWIPLIIYSITQFVGIALMIYLGIIWIGMLLFDWNRLVSFALISLGTSISYILCGISSIDTLNYYGLALWVFLPTLILVLAAIRWLLLRKSITH